MLLNLLIAIFTSVFDKVNENSKEVWKWEMYRLATEYDRKPGLAPPLVIIEDIWKLLKNIWKLTDLFQHSEQKPKNIFVRILVQTKTSLIPFWILPTS